MIEKQGQIQGKWDLVRVSGGVRVIRVRVTGVLLYLFIYLFIYFILFFYKNRAKSSRGCNEHPIPVGRGSCDQVLFSFRSVKHSGGKGETKNRA